MTATIAYQLSPHISNEALNRLFHESWDHHQERDFSKVLERSLLYICVFDKQALIGFVNIAWDGGEHSFLLDTTVHPNYRKRGIGTRLVKKAMEALQERGVTWLHVDYEAHLEEFYTACGFTRTKAGLYQFHKFESSASSPLSSKK